MYRLAPYAEGEVVLRLDGTEMVVTFGGAEVARFSSGREWRQGWSTTLPNGIRLEVKSLRPVLFPELSVLVGGRHVDDSPSHPRRMLKASAQGLLIGAAIFVVLALTGRYTVGTYNVIWELLMAAGALLLLRHMYTGLVLTGLALLADFVIIDIMLFTNPGRHLIWPVVTLLFFSMFFLRAFIALHDVRRRYS